MPALVRVRKKPGARVGVPGFVGRGCVLAWVKPAVFGFEDAGAVTAAGVCFHLAGRFPASRVRFIGTEFGGVRVSIVKFASALDVVDDVEGADFPCWRLAGAHLAPFPASTKRLILGVLAMISWNICFSAHAAFVPRGAPPWL